MSNLYPVEIDPIALEKDLQERMMRYLLTALPINRRFPNLREEARQKLQVPGSLVKGPFLEALPDFPKGDSLKDLVERGILHPAFAGLEPNVYNRPLHQHQVDAIQSVVVEKKNVVVATGTGSGKTECFLFPMIDELLKADIAGKPGVRAILVYPLNALANDQLYARLVPVLAKQLGEFGITVGRYTGQTSSTKNRNQIQSDLLGAPNSQSQMRKLFGDTIPDNWLLSRQEMRTTPPHVLVTNYAMLEHLLLLPRNAELFKNADLRFMVLDEVHVYAGAQATEVALLLRKLKNRYAKGRDVRSMGTSASLGNSEDAKQKVLHFASRLFGAAFSQVVTADRLRHHLLRSTTPTTTRGAEDWHDLHNQLNKVRNLPEPDQLGKWMEESGGIERLGIPASINESLPHYLCRLLSKDMDVHKLADYLSEKDKRPLSVVAAALFPVESAEIANQGLKSLVALAAYAREEAGGFPLLPARYHLFTRGIEDATVEIQNREVNPEQVGNLRFRREFLDAETGRPRYRLMTCRKCGELYFEGYELAGRLLPERSSKFAQRAVFWCNPKADMVLPSDLDEDEADGAGDHEEVFIHEQTGIVKVQLDDGDSPEAWIHTQRARMKVPGPNTPQEDQRPLVVTCHSCGSKDPTEVITAFHPGDQALSSTICEVLYSHLPTLPDVAQRDRLPGSGRNLLVFSDNRQDAAFFAPNFQRTHEDILVKRELVNHLKNHEHWDSLNNIVASLSDNPIIKTGLTDESGKRPQLGDPDEFMKILRARIFREFACPGGSRQSLEELGLVEVGYTGVQNAEIIEQLRLDPEIGKPLVRWVIDSIRQNRAIDMPSGITQTSEFAWGPYNQENRAYLLDNADRAAKFRLISLRARGGLYLNRYLEVIRDKLNLPDPESILTILWRHLTDADYGILKPLREGHNPMVIRHSRIRAKLSSNDSVYFRCGKCGKVSSYNLGGVCTQWRCSGNVDRLNFNEWRNEMESNHYHYLYSRKCAFPSVMAREHTAALTAELRQELESQFKKRKLNILSSSTTMEVGIDLGDLEGVFLRNAPPDVSNYQQRAGRAGRRAQAAPVSITYAKNSRYDQDVYERAEAFLNKIPRTPAVHLSNPRLFQRHQFSILLSDYLAFQGLAGTGLQIGQLFGLPKFVLSGLDLIPDDIHRSSDFTEENEAQFLTDIDAWMNSPDSETARRLAADLLSCLKPELTGAEFDGLQEVANGIASGFGAAMNNLVKTFGARYRHYNQAAGELRNAHKDSAAARLANDAKRWANQPIVNFLSKYGIIPSYSFPIDNIELQVMDGSRQRGNFKTNSANIELTRDAKMGIREYAPGAEVVANGRVWTSAGIAHAPREFMPTFAYKACSLCQHIESWEDESLIPANCSSCSNPLDGAVQKHKEPKGFITSAHEPEGKEPGYRRVPPPPATESRLIGNAPEHRFKGSDISIAEWVYQSAQEGRMIILNKGKGRGFRSCRCGWTFAVPTGAPGSTAHRNPYTGLECENDPNFSRFHLSHTFHTDLLQIRVMYPVPEPADLPPGINHEERLQAQEGVARSIAESVRLATSQRLDIPEAEISATYRWKPPGLEIILFDSVSGGAGYCKKVYEMPLSEIVSAAADFLDCPANCTRSCSRCLRSYSNQVHWDEFRRQDALKWLRGVSEQRRDDPLIQAGGAQISLRRLEELCTAATKIILMRRSLGDLAGGLPLNELTREEATLSEMFPGWNLIQQWLAMNKSVALVYAKVENFQDPANPRALRVARAFMTHVEDRKLSLHEIPGNFKGSGPIGALLDGAGQRATLIYSRDYVGSLLEGVWPTSLMTLEIPIAQVQDHFHLPDPKLLDALRPPAGVNHRKFAMGESRDLKPIFGFMSGEAIQAIEIVDRYLFAASHNAQALSDLLRVFSGLWSSPPKTIKLSYGPSTNQADDQMWRNTAFQSVLALQNDPLFNGIRFEPNMRSFRDPKGDKHDRRILIRYERNLPIPPAPQKEHKVMIAELTGGVSHLMDDQFETNVFSWIG